MDFSPMLEDLVALNNDFVQNQDQAVRGRMLVAAQKLMTSLQTPTDFVSYTLWSEPARSACVRTAMDLGIFETLTQDDSKEGVEVGQMAESKGANKELVSRIMKHLTAMGVVREVSHDRYANTTLSAQLSAPIYKDGIMICYDVFGPSFFSMPAYFKKTGYNRITDPGAGPFQFAHNTEEPFFPWLSKNPPYMGQFAHYMSGHRAGQMPWYDTKLYPFQAQVLEGYQPTSTTAPFIVDVGGGRGHDLLALSATFGSFPGPAFLQDLPEVISINESNLSKHEIKAMSHDFFTPQPIIGARTYLLNSVLHDWNDEDCIRILKALKPAMKPGLSKLLVREVIVPNENAKWDVTSIDFVLMSCLSARERTVAEFHHLFDAAGLNIDKIWVHENTIDGVIEASSPA